MPTLKLRASLENKMWGYSVSLTFVYMIAKALFNIHGLLFEAIGHLEIEPLHITNNHSYRNEFFTDEIKSEIGEIALGYPVKAAYAYCDIEIDTVNKSTADIQKELASAVRYYSHNLLSFLNFLWFIKDNSIYLGTSYIHIPEIKRSIVEVSSTSVTNTCIGNRIDTFYSPQEIVMVEKIYYKCAELCPPIKSLTDEDFVWETDMQGKHIRASQGHGKSFNYGEYNIFQRAFNFLGVARRLDYLVFRIASYMPLLECIFTDERNEVTQKVCERVAFYLGEEMEDRMQIFRDVKWCYDLRSAYLHGQVPGKSHVNRENLIEKSTRMDELIRATLTMIIMNDSHIFNNGKMRTHYLRNLIFGEQAYLLDPEYIKEERERVEKQANKDKKR